MKNSSLITLFPITLFPITLVLVAAAVAGTSRADESQPFRFMTAERDAEYRSYLPQVDESQVTELLSDPRLILYTEREMPPAYQDWSSGLPGVHSPSYNISADGGEPFGNGNREFPWSAPAGTHRTDGVRAFRFLHLPQDKEGNTLPIVWFPKSLRGATSTGYAWRYPVGTTFGEVLQLRSPEGGWLTFEMRLRIRELDDWAVNVFRPFRQATELAEAIKQARPQWEQNEKLAALVKHLEEPAVLPRKVLSDSHPRQSFRQTMGVDSLPPVGDDKLVGELLKETTFKSSLGLAWRRGTKGQWTAAPTTESPFHVIPARYDAGFVEVERTSCMRCHETVNHSVRDFEPFRDWYGRIRGSDGIFSFHPFAKSSISYNGSSVSTSMRSELVQAGLLERFDLRKHPVTIYNSIRKLDE